MLATSPLARILISLIIQLFSDEKGRNNFHFEFHPEFGLTLDQVIRKNGYPVEIHEVETEDHYHLRLYRVPGGSQPDEYKNKSLVLIVHGLGGTPNHFTNLGKDKALVYYLADRGFDVWLLASRGTFGSNYHQRYDWRKDFEYWNFSFHEMGVYDLPASIDYMLAKTGQNKIFYIGQSSGTTNYFVMTTARKEYNAKIKIGVSYAPAVILKHMSAPIFRIFSSLRQQLIFLRERLKLGYMWPFGKVGIDVLKYLCSEKTAISESCLQLSNIVGGRDSVLIDKNTIGLAISSLQANICTKQALHYLQVIHTGFKKFDYGPEKNMELYGSKYPSEYNLTNSVAPAALFWGENDFITAPDDVRYLSKNLKNVLSYKVPFKYFNHIDFIAARNAPQLVYEPTVKLFKAYDEGIIPQNIGDFDL